MANKRTTLIIESKGGEKVERDLKKIGAVGETTGKKIKKGSAEANKGLKAVDATVARTKVGMRQLGDRLGPLGAGLGKLGSTGLLAAAGITAFALSITKVVAAGNEAEKANFKIAALLKTTGSSSGQTAESIDRIAKSIGDMTLASTNGVREAAAVLLTFKSVAGDAFERTLKVSQDLASVMGTDIKAATIQLAKALEDPERNLSQLNRSGISFTTNQVDLIKSLVQTGREAEALSAILGQIEGQLGGAGEAEAAGLAGRFDSLGERIGIFAENVSESTGLMSGFTKAIDLMARGMKAINETVFPDVELQIADQFARLSRINAALESGVGRRNNPGRQRAKADAEEELTRLIAIRDAQVQASVAAKEAAEVQRKARLDARESAEAVKVEVKAEAAAKKAQLTADKKFATERKRALSDIARLQNKAAKAGLEGVALLEAARDEELRKQFARLESEVITSQQFADARLAIEKTFQTEKADQEEKAAAKTTATLAKNAKKQVSVFVAPFSTAASNIQSSFADTFTDIYRGSVTTFEDLADSIKDIMARLAGEITALMVIRPVIAGISGSFAGSAGASAAGGAAGSAAGAGASGGIGAFLATGAGSNALAAAIAIGAGIAGNYVGNQISGFAGINTNQGGNIGGLAGGIAGAAFFGPGGAFLGAAAGNVLGNAIGNAFGAGSNETTRFGFSTGRPGATGVDSPFGVLNVDRQRGIDAVAVLDELRKIDESIAGLLSEQQIAAVTSDLAGTSQRFDVNKFDNEPFDVVKTRLVRIIDAVAENTVASGLLNSIGRDPGNIDALVQEAQKVIQLINVFNDEGADLNNAELALKGLNEQFDALSITATQLGFSLTLVEQRRQDAIKNLTADFNTSVRDQILAIIDPLTLALEAQEAAAIERLANARTLGADLVEVERLNALERTKILESQADAFASANSSISGFLQSLGTTGAGGLSISQQSSNASTLFNQLLGSARTDPTARQDLASLLPTFVGLKQEELGSTAAFFEFTSFLDSTLRNLVDQGDTVSTLQDIGEAITAGDNAVIQTLESENAKLIDEIADLRTDINLLLNSPAAVG